MATLLRDLLRDYPNDPEKVVALVRAMGDVAVEHLLPSLYDEDAEQRKTAAQLLALLDDRRAVPALIEALDVRGLAIQRFATERRKEANDWVFAGGRIYSPYTRGAIQTAIEQALEATDRHAVAEVRTQCAFALGKLGDSRALEPLSHLLNDRDESVRNAARLAIDWIRLGQAGEEPLPEL
jgi:HEAT repeat protein